MLSKALIRLIQSLQQKKFRREHKLFVAEGTKTVCDLLASDMRCSKLIATQAWHEQHHPQTGAEIIIATNEELQRASFLRTPQGVIGLFEIVDFKTDTTIPGKELTLALDDIQDPGNLGTIIRIADWFGIEHIYCSTGTADMYNPKVVQATMGAIARVKLHYLNLPQFLKSLPEGTPLYGAFLDGANIYNEQLSKNGVIVMGNEGNGISKECEEVINRRLFIPNFPPHRETSESLNVSTATAIVCSEFRRR